MERKLVRETFFKFFPPTLASSVTLSVLSMTDLVIAGQFVGEKGLAAISLALPVTIFVQIVAALMGMGGAIVFSARLGEGDMTACSQVFTLSLAGTLCCGILASAAGLFWLEPLIGMLGASGGEEFQLASVYIGTLFAGMPFMILSPVMMTFLRNDSKQGYSMFCVVFCALFNLIFSLVFCIVCGMGIRGIGLATILSQFLACILAGVKLFQKNKSYGLVRRFFSWERLAAILKPGSTVALIFFCQVLLTVMVNRILITEGGAAVYAVVKYLINFLFALFDGVTGAVQPMLGIYYGEREKENVKATAEYSFRTMAVVSGIMFLFLELGGGIICHLFGVESEHTRNMTIEAVRIIGFYCFGAAAVTFLNSFYRCVGREKISFFMGLFDNLVVPFSCILFFVYGCHMGTRGVFLGLSCGAFCTLALWAVICRPWKNGVLLLDETQFPGREQEYHEIVAASPKEVGQVMERVEEYCEAMAISPKKQFYINLSIEELIVNVAGLAEEDNQKKKRKKEYYADIRIAVSKDGTVRLRIRDNLTEWVPTAFDIHEVSLLEHMPESGGMNEFGIGIIKKIAREYSYKRTIGFNNFSVIL